jgi:hypothetical protein
MMTISVETCSAPVIWKIIWKLKNLNIKILTQVCMWDSEQEVTITESLNNLVVKFYILLSLLYSYYNVMILFLLPLGLIGPCSLRSWLVPWSPGTWFNAVFNHCRLVWLIQTHMPDLYLTPHFSGSICLPVYTFPHSHEMLQVSETFSPKSSFYWS